MSMRFPNVSAKQTSRGVHKTGWEPPSSGVHFRPALALGEWRLRRQRGLEDSRRGAGPQTKTHRTRECEGEALGWPHLFSPRVSL